MGIEWTKGGINPEISGVSYTNGIRIDHAVRAVYASDDKAAPYVWAYAWKVDGMPIQVRATPFTSVADAKAFAERVHSQGEK